MYFYNINNLVPTTPYRYTPSPNIKLLKQKYPLLNCMISPMVAMYQVPFYILSCVLKQMLSPF